MADHAIMCWHRDEYGCLPVFDIVAGHYRFMTAAERKAHVEAEMQESPRHAALPRHPPEEFFPHPHNCNRVSYGRGDPDRHVNWPQKADGTSS